VLRKIQATTRSGLAQNTAEPHHFYVDSAPGRILMQLRTDSYCKASQHVKTNRYRYRYCKNSSPIIIIYLCLTSSVRIRIGFMRIRI
jgi:hypothetical protein